MTLEEKYNEYRKVAQDGDILLCRSEKFVGKSICKITKSYYSHSLVVFWKAGRLFIFDAQADGIKPKLASDRILSLYTDFCVIRMYNFAENHLTEFFEQSEKGIKYDFKQIGKIALYELSKGKINLFPTKVDENDGRAICSEESWVLTKIVKVMCYDKSLWKTPFFLPQYFYDMADKKEVAILFTENIF